MFLKTGHIFHYNKCSGLIMLTLYNEKNVILLISNIFLLLAMACKAWPVLLKYTIHLTI